MTSKMHPLSWLAPYVMALAALLAADALAQAARPVITVAGIVAPTEDMRLWSFGDCDRRFPYVNTDTHKECVRVVGSPEARDARALRVCEVSNGGADREETERCKSAYLANKEKAAQETLAASSPAGALPPPSPEVMSRVKAITTAAIEDKQAAAQAETSPAVAAPEAPPAQVQAESSSVSTIAVVLLVAALGGLGATVMRRKQAQSA